MFISPLAMWVVQQSYSLMSLFIADLCSIWEDDMGGNTRFIPCCRGSKIFTSSDVTFYAQLLEKCLEFIYEETSCHGLPSNLCLKRPRRYKRKECCWSLFLLKIHSTLEEVTMVNMTFIKNNFSMYSTEGSDTEQTTGRCLYKY